MPVLLAPLFLLGGLAVLVPLALHLLHRRRPRPVNFSTVRFLHQALAETRRARRLNNLTVLLLRMLVILLLALAFARPKVRFASWLPAGPRTVVVVLDASASMQTVSGETTHFTQARAWARDLVRRLTPADRVCVFAPGRAQSTLVFPPLTDHGAVDRALATAGPGFGRCDLLSTVSDALRRLGTDDEAVGIEVHVFSDFQSGSWSVTTAETLDRRAQDRGFVLFLNRVGMPPTANCGIVGVRGRSGTHLGAGAVLQVTVQTGPDRTAPNILRALHDGRVVGERSFTVTPGAEFPVSLVLSDLPQAQDEPVIKLELEPDRFAADNQHFLVLPSSPGHRVILVDPGPSPGPGPGPNTLYAWHALAPGGTGATGFAPLALPLDSLPAGVPAEVSVLLLCNPGDPPAGTADTLVRFLAAGGTVIAFPGDGLTMTELSTALPPLDELSVRVDEQPLLESVPLLPHTPPTALERRVLAVLGREPVVPVRNRLRIDTPLPASARPLLRYPDGTPFCVGLPVGDGVLWLVSVSANRDWSEWPLSPSFVVVLQELVRTAFPDDLATLAMPVGGTFQLRPETTALTLDVTLRSPTGTTESLQLERTDTAAPFAVSGFQVPGLHTVTHPTGTRNIAVNTPPEESDSRATAPEEIATLLPNVQVLAAADPETLWTRLSTARHGRPLWPLILALAFITACVEELVANLHSRVQGMGGRPARPIPAARRAGR